MITAADLRERLRTLEPIGLSERGTNRLAWTAEAAASDRWFQAQAVDGGLTMSRDPAGNLWACSDHAGPWWGVGSHLDSVRDGGRFDGALGVAAAFAVASRVSRPVAVVSFADEEGARFNTPTFGSRALVGRLDVGDVLARHDDDGIRLADAMRTAGVDMDGLDGAVAWLERLAGFLEIHIDQSTDVAATGAPIGVVRTLASRLRLQVDLHGEADHAGTTTRAERRDALTAAARLIVAADELAAAEPAFVVTASRILVFPNALTTVPAEVRLWLDARAPPPGLVDSWHESLVEIADQLARRTGVEIEVAVASRSAGVSFDADLRRRLLECSRRKHPAAPEVTCFAGHDAGVLAERIPAGMVLVRNPSGVSHSPREDVALEDAATAANVVVSTLESLD